MLINKSIPSLFNGVSQQPASMRHTSQCEVADNIYPTVAIGFSKRTNTEYRAKLRDTLDREVFSKLINRDTSERYEVFIADGMIEVYDLITFEKKTVNTPDGLGYLTSENPKIDFNMTTIADHSFVLNRTVKAGMAEGKKPANPVNIGFANVIASPASHAFHITVNGTTATVSLGAGGATISGLADSLRSELSTKLGGGYSVTRFTSGGIMVEKVDGGEVEITASDTYGNEGVKAISNGVSRFSYLPATLIPDYVIEVIGDPDNSESDYYVEYKDGRWIETTASDISNEFDLSTMPHVLIREADGTFTFKQAEWAGRTTGDEDSNPNPSFIGASINDIYLIRNRLGLLADENVVLSRANEFYSFYGESARTVIDSDPIDAPAPGNKVSILKYAVSFNKVLLLFSDQTQFQLTAGETLTPKTARIDPTTSFESSPLVRPVSIGMELFFTVARGGYSGVREYYVDNTTVSNDAIDITAHVDSYVPGDIFKLASSSNEDLLVAASAREPNVLYAYKFYWSKDEKLQSAWFRFIFEEGVEILDMDFIANNLYLIIKRADGVYLETMNFQPSLEDRGLSFRVLLDRRVTLTGSYDPATKLTTWELPYTPTGPVSVVLGGSFEGQRGFQLFGTTVEGNKVTAKGDYSGGEAFIGVPYTMRYEFSEQYAEDGQKNALLSATVKLRRMLVNYSDSGYFRINVTPWARQTYTYVFTGTALGDASAVIGTVPIVSGSYRFPIKSSNLRTRIEIINDSHLPSHFQSAEWEAEMVVKSQRG
ncbi:hypothetical protein NB640_12400 [Oxalobacter vibrioformis]|uniref:Tail tubular protein B n=1 Tax=Oxalobacter vibrioformis TaxID=933080 RepID=A0A9E9LXD8_9BURK|nr:hypothetical protein [Oxalobacter vibrioformis]WAW10001.1 hypothetical protein NB640_12400 [Oxalobacter vibrioformis]